MKEFGLAAVVTGVLLAFVSCSKSQDRVRVEGCRDALIESLARKFGPCPPDQRRNLEEAATNSCKDLLGVK